MLTEESIRRDLHASRVVPLDGINPHGPMGLEQLAAAVAANRATAPGPATAERVRRPIELPLETWEKLQRLAASTSQAGTPRVSASELAAVIIQQYVLDAPP